MNVVDLEQYEIDKLIDGLFLSTQQRRFIQYVATNPHSLTVAVNNATAIGNISYVSSRVNEKLMPLGYVIACVKPLESISNRFGEPSRMYEWSMFKLPQRAANDSLNASALEVSQ
tara:strand:- start:1145 stop:1489 length:345 start_codon:yes stop_codon:yes gene_type:complete